MGTEIVQFEAVKGMAEAVAKSKLWRSVDTPEKAMALMLLCQAEGLHPMTAVRRYDLIQGTPTLKAEAQLAEFYSRGGVVKWIQRSSEVCEAKFSHPKHCPDGVVIKWTLDDAKRAGLMGKDNWRNFPRQMLSARVSAEGVQVVDPGAGLGMLTPEEAIDVQHLEANRANAAAADLTGQPAPTETAVEVIPEVPPMEEKDFKKLRGKLNQALLKCKTEAESKAACAEFNKEYSAAIWPRKTLHNDFETFESLAYQHLGRLLAEDARNHPEGHRAGHEAWRMACAKADAKRFKAFEESYNRNADLHSQENQDALHARGRELGLADYDNTDDNEVYQQAGTPE